jgi:hypothetical protein
MMTKSKFAVLLALATLGLASPALANSRPAVDWNTSAQSRQIGQKAADNPARTGGGSTAYNLNMRTDY